MPGDFVELVGSPQLSDAGLEFFAHGVTRLGAGEMPTPVRLRSEFPKSGTNDAKWTEIDGVGRTADAEGKLLLMTRAGALELALPAGSALTVTNWANSLVRVRGVLRHQPAPTLLVPGARFLQILEAPPADPFAVPTFSVQKVLGLNGEMRLARRLKIAGVVTSQRKDAVYLEDATGGLRVESLAATGVKVGDAVEVVGFPVERSVGVAFAEAMIRPAQVGVKLVPPVVEPDESMHVSNNCRLVSIDAVLLAQHLGGEVQTLDVQSGQRAFLASLPVSAGALPAIAVGSRLQLTGVAVLDAGGASAQETGGERALMGALELLLRSPADVVVVERPPWWNWKYTAATSGCVVIVLAGAVLWIRTLRRRVEQRTEQLQETMGKLQRETQISATLAERDRLAGEIHDSIEQGLSAIMMQMEAASKLVDRPEEVRRYLNLARNMAGFSRAEVQHAVWDMQSPLLENADLITALRRVAQDISAGDTPRVEVAVAGEVFPLTSAEEHHLLRIAQEAITNAVKHGAAKMIQVALQYDSRSVTLSVGDDGAGFVPESVSAHGGHFGLQGMRARAQKINAKISIKSAPGEGTCIIATAPRGSRVMPLEANPDQQQNET